MISVSVAGSLLAVSALAADASPTELDQSFGNQGVASLHAGGAGDTDVAASVAVGPDASIVLAGAAQSQPPPGSTSPPSAKVAVARLTRSGSPDATFGTGGSTVTDLGGVATGIKVGVQSDNKVVVLAVVITPSPGAVQATLLRYTSAGVLDTTFGPGGKVTVQSTSGNVSAYGLAIDPAGNILVAGTVVGTGGSTSPFVERFTTLGLPDPSFGTAGSARPPDAGLGTSVVVIPDGHVMLGGQSGKTLAVWRFSSAGALDTAYGSSGRATVALPAPFGPAVNLAAGPDNTVAAISLLGLSPLVARFSPTGALDTTFGHGGTATVDLPGGAFATGGVVSSDRKVLIGGISGSGFVARLNADGTPDRTFAPDGKTQLRIATGANFVLSTGGPAVGADAKPVLAGTRFGFNSQASPPSASVDLAAIRFQGGAGGVAPPPDTATRRAGPDRIATAVAVSQATFADASSGPTPADSRLQAAQVVLASSEAFPDALVGTPFASAMHAPLLLSHAAALDDVTLNEIKRVLGNPGHSQQVTVLGGPAALSTAVTDSLVNAGFTVNRIAGANRYDTAAKVAGAIEPAAEIFEATGHDFADGVTAGAAAAHLRGVVLLTDGAAQAPETQSYISAHPSLDRYAIGGPAAGVDPAAVPVVGVDRYDTSVQVATRFFATPSNVGVATGSSYPDALSGGSRQAAYGGPILLTNPDVLPSGVESYLNGLAPWIDTADVYGGLAVTSDAVLIAIQHAITA